MLHLCYHFYIIILKIKHELHIAPGSDFPCIIKILAAHLIQEKEGGQFSTVIAFAYDLEKNHENA